MNNKFDYAKNTIDAKRSTFKKPCENMGTCNLGEIIPFYLEEVYPGDTVTINTASVVRTGALIAPIFGNLYQDIYYFFVPNRLVWEHWPQFLGENDTSAWTQKTEYTIPITNNTSQVRPNGLLGYMEGWPDWKGDAFGTYKGISELPLRGYYMIYNEWFRNQAYEAPILFSKGDKANDYISYTDSPKIANKFRDYYTSALPEPQKGDPVSLPLAGEAPIDASTALHSFTNVPRLFNNESLSQSDGYAIFSNEYGDLKMASGVSQMTVDSDVGAFLDKTNLIADLSKATATTIETLRVAYATQRYLERDALFGSRMDEVIQSHFGVNNGANIKYIPEYLTGERIHLNIDQVLATAQTGDNTSIQNPQGNVAGWSCTGNITEGFTKSFTEHGWLFGISVIRQQNVYSGTIRKGLFRKNKLDFYWPEFANIGEQPIYSSETGQSNSEDADNENPDFIFGYQEAWAELRYGKNIVSALLNPQNENALDYWTLADHIGGAPNNFIKANKESLDRALAVSSETTGAQFIFDIATNATWTRILPLFSDPSIIDKH